MDVWCAVMARVSLGEGIPIPLLGLRKTLSLPEIECLSGDP
jgi:hypothetical protein